MSTKASIAWDEEKRSFHLYEELMDGQIWLEVDVERFEVHGPEGPGPVRIRFPVPRLLMEKVFKEKYRKSPGDGGLFLLDFRKGTRRLYKDAETLLAA